MLGLALGHLSQRGEDPQQWWMSPPPGEVGDASWSPSLYFKSKQQPLCLHNPAPEVAGRPLQTRMATLTQGSERAPSLSSCS